MLTTARLIVMVDPDRFARAIRDRVLDIVDIKVNPALAEVHGMEALHLPERVADAALGERSAHIPTPTAGEVEHLQVRAAEGLQVRAHKTQNVYVIISRACFSHQVPEGVVEVRAVRAGGEGATQGELFNQRLRARRVADMQK